MGMIREQSTNSMLQEFIGQHAMPIKTVEEFTGIHHKRIEKHIAVCGSTRPNVDDLFAYFELFPAFRRRYFAQRGYHIEKINRRSACGFKVMEHMGSALAVLSPALADGRIDDRERGYVLPAVELVEDELTAFRVSIQ